MAKAEQGDTVKVHYTGTLSDGTEFDSSRDRDPLEFTVGANEVLPDFEIAVVDMDEGESKTITITAENAYGPYRDDMKLTIPREQIPKGLEVEIGNQYHIPQQNGHSVVVTVTNIEGDEVTLDANHPLAGEDLTFDIEVVAVEK